MATVTEPTAPKVRETASIVIDGATWADYEAMLGIIGDRHIFVNYDQGVMELEANYTHSSVNRMPIYASLGVDEVWRYDDGLMFFALRDDGTYEPTNPSSQLPYLSISEATRQIELYMAMGRLNWMRAFRRYVREKLISPPALPDGGEPPGDISSPNA